MLLGVAGLETTVHGNAESHHICPVVGLLQLRIRYDAACQNDLVQIERHIETSLLFVDADEYALLSVSSLDGSLDSFLNHGLLDDGGLSLGNRLVVQLDHERAKNVLVDLAKTLELSGEIGLTLEDVGALAQGDLPRQGIDGGLVVVYLEGNVTLLRGLYFVDDL